ncbi:MAG: 3-phenylpropionate/cinnamic acid dioxygenase subunit beta [Candidatus Binataceae bacterium]|nr:3-phenylpropionate/cinnamic acid dioxygenase subunit beta [Candidatus Binataceae bacterium]
MASASVSPDLHQQVLQFYYREARLFSGKQYRQWLEAMVDREIHYWLPIADLRYRADRRPPPEFVPSIYDDNYDDLEERIRRLETGLVWMEDPPSRIRHLTTNVEVYGTDVASEFDSFSNFLVCRNTEDTDETLTIGAREDRLRLRDGNLTLLRRKVILGQRVIKDTNLYFLM